MPRDAWLFKLKFRCFFLRTVRKKKSIKNCILDFKNKQATRHLQSVLNVIGEFI